MSVNNSLASQGAFAKWTSGRSVPFLGTNHGGEAIAFQRWRRFKEAFAPELVHRAVADSNIPVNSCLDPFSGSGTTAIACQFLGVVPTAIEVNPYLADLTECKLVPYNTNEIRKVLHSVLRQADLIDLRSVPRQRFPNTFVEPGNDGKYLFPTNVFNRIRRISYAIQQLKSQRYSRLLKVILGEVAVSNSNIIVSGKGRRYKANWQNFEANAQDVDARLAAALSVVIDELNEAPQRLTYNYCFIRGDCRKALSNVQRYDLAVFSPPYPNSFDYTDVYNVELWMLGYLKTPVDNRELRQSTFSSHVQIKKDYCTPKNIPNILSECLKRLEVVRRDLWHKDIPEMICSYFAEMEIVLARLFNSLKPGARAYVVIGDSRYNDILVRVGELQAIYAELCGFEVIDIVPFRSMRTSPQQGGKMALKESLLILRRPFQ